MSYDPNHAITAAELVALAEVSAAEFSSLVRLSVQDIDEVIGNIPTATTAEEKYHAAIAIANFTWTAAAWYREIQKHGGAYAVVRHRYSN